ncbi:MAG: twin-arginine translocation signal domain-containing protein, partial [Candidatus Acidiferrales bacterium]
MKRDPEDKKNLSRRDFVKTTGAGVGTAVLAGLGFSERDAQTRPPHWDKEADVVVVGAGASG